MSKGIVAVICDAQQIGKHIFHVVGEKYIVAARQAAGCFPVLIPVLPDRLDIDEILSSVDGVMMTGALSNVHPRQYDGPASRPETLHDRQRDATALDLIRATIDRGVPLLCVCRGHQELNVAMGGTLHQYLWEVEGRDDHRDDDTQPLDVQYGPAHAVAIEAGGVLERIYDQDTLMVNSLHGQAIDRLGGNLRVEARAPDGTIEAVSVDDAPGFTLSVQWHPEWKVMENAEYEKIFKVFGDAVAEQTGK